MTSGVSSGPKERVAWLDIARAMSIVLVVIYHVAVGGAGHVLLGGAGDIHRQAVAPRQPRSRASADAAVLHGLGSAGRRCDTTTMESGGTPADLRPSVALCVVEHDLGRYRVAPLCPGRTGRVLRRGDHRIVDDRFALL